MTGGDRYARGMVSGGFTPVLENHMQGYLKQFEPKQDQKKSQPGWWFQPLRKIWKSVGMIRDDEIPNIWKVIKKCSTPPTSNIGGCVWKWDIPCHIANVCGGKIMINQWIGYLSIGSARAVPARWFQYAHVAVDWMEYQIFSFSQTQEGVRSLTSSH